MVSNVYPDSKVHGAHMGPTWVLSAPDGPHVGPMYLAITVDYGLLHILKQFRRTVSCFNWEMNILLSVAFEGVRTLQKSLCHAMWLYYTVFYR